MRYRTLFQVMVILVISSVVVSCEHGALSPTPTLLLPDAVASGEIVEIEHENIQQELLSLPADCDSKNCFWWIEVGEITYWEFREILLEIYVASTSIYQDNDDLPLSGIHSRVIFTANLKPDQTSEDIVDYISLSAYLSNVEGWYDISSILPSAIITTFGVPDEAFMEYYPNTNGYRLYLFYDSDAFVYELEGTFRDNIACLSLDELEQLTLHRFPDGKAAMNYLGRWGDLPPEMTDLVEQSLDDLALIPDNPNDNCLSLEIE